MWNVLFKALSRQCQSGVSTKSPVLDDSLIFSSEEWTLPFSTPPFALRFGTLASTGTLTIMEKTLEFDAADIPQHHKYGSKFHQAERFQELFSKFETDPWRLSPFCSLLRAVWGLLPPWYNSQWPCFCQVWSDKPFIFAPGSVEDYTWLSLS